jgi:hypothetical protein
MKGDVSVDGKSFSLQDLAQTGRVHASSAASGAQAFQNPNGARIKIDDLTRADVSVQLRIVGVGRFPSRIAWQMFFRSAIVRQHTGGSGVHLADATPAKNSPLEFLSLLSFLETTSGHAWVSRTPSSS